MKNVKIIIGVLLLLASCDQESGFSTLNIDEYFTEPIEILKPSDRYIIGTPSSILVDKESNIIVADDLGMQILYFESNGVFKKTVGQRGRGPLEFLHLTTVSLDQEGKVIVADQFNSRFTVIGDTNHSIHTFNPGEILWPRKISSTENGYILAYKLDVPLSDQSDSFLSRNSKSNYLFHYSDDLESIDFSFGNILNMPYQDDQFYQTWLGFNPGNILYDQNRLIYIPFIYEGKVYSYDYLNEERHINQITEFQRKPFTRIDRTPIPDHAIHISGRVASAATIESESINVLRLDNDKFIYFSFQVVAGQKKLFFEVFNSSFSLIKTGFIYGLGDFNLRHNSSIFKIEAFDGEKFYVIDLRNRENEWIFTFELDL